MSLSLQSANLVRQKTYMSVRNGGIFMELKALFLHLASNKSNPDLQLVNIDGGATASDGGNTASQVAANVACTLYAVYAKKTGAVATWLKVTDNATTATTNGGADFSTVLTVAKDETLFTWPTGHAMANGITYTEDTTATGSTLNLLANRIDGFIIFGQ